MDRYRIETSRLHGGAYRVIDIRYASSDPRHVVADNVSQARAMAIIAEEA